MYRTVISVLLAVSCLAAYCRALSAYDFQRIRERNVDSVPRVFDPDFLKPIGYIAGEPIWPRTYEALSSGGDLTFDENGGSYLLAPPPSYNAVFRRSSAGGIGSPKYFRYARSSY